METDDLEKAWMDIWKKVDTQSLFAIARDYPEERGINVSFDFFSGTEIDGNTLSNNPDQVFEAGRVAFRKLINEEGTVSVSDKRFYGLSIHITNFHGSTPGVTNTPQKNLNKLVTFDANLLSRNELELKLIEGCFVCTEGHETIVPQPRHARQSISVCSSNDCRRSVHFAPQRSTYGSIQRFSVNIDGQEFEAIASGVMPFNIGHLNDGDEILLRAIPRASVSSGSTSLDHIWLDTSYVEGSMY